MEKLKRCLKEKINVVQKRRLLSREREIEVFDKGKRGLKFKEIS